MGLDLPSTCPRCDLTYVGFVCCPSCAPSTAWDEVNARPPREGAPESPRERPVRSFKQYLDTLSAWDQLDAESPAPAKNSAHPVPIIPYHG